MDKLPYPVVAVRAIDWVFYEREIDVHSNFDRLEGWIVGFLIQEDDEKIVIAQQYFTNKDVRYTSVISKITVKERIDLVATPAPSAED